MQIKYALLVTNKRCQDVLLRLFFDEKLELILTIRELLICDVGQKNKKTNLLEEYAVRWIY